MNHSPRGSLAGTTPVLLAWAMAFGGLFLLAAVLHLSGEEEPRPVEARYLSEERTALRGRSRARQEANRRAAERVRRARRRGGFLHASANRLFAVRGEDDGALRTDLQELMTSPDVLLRLYGTPDGDFLFHRTRGWLHFVDGRWVEVDFDELPRALRLAHPHLRRAAPDAGGDTDFEDAFWLTPAEGAAA